MINFSPVLRLITKISQAHAASIEFTSGVHFSAEDSQGQRRVSQKRDIVFSAESQITRLMLPLQHRILFLVGIQLTNGQVPLHLFRRGVRTTNRPDLAFLL